MGQQAYMFAHQLSLFLLTGKWMVVCLMKDYLAWVELEQKMMVVTQIWEIDLKPCCHMFSRPKDLNCLALAGSQVFNFVQGKMGFGIWHRLARQHSFLAFSQRICQLPYLDLQLVHVLLLIVHH